MCVCVCVCVCVCLARVHPVFRQRTPVPEVVKIWPKHAEHFIKLNIKKFLCLEEICNFFVS